MKSSEQLSLEQKFSLRAFAALVQTLSPEEAQDLSIELYRRMMLKDNLYAEMFQDYWDISSFSVSV